MRGPELKEITKGLPGGPGIYIFRGAKGEPLYIGKASNLKSRVSAYLPAGRQARKTEDMRIQTMLKNAHMLDFETTDTDIEALILESQLVRKHKPRFNIMLRDDKNYFYVAFTREDFPRIFLTHQLKAKSSKLKAEYIGPFTEGVSLKTTLRFLRRLFPYCTCKQKHHVRCLNAHIGKCLGFCCLKDNEQLTTDNKKQYAQNIKAIRDILAGRRESLIKEFEKEMKRLGKDGELREAAELKSKIERVRRVFQNARIIRTQASRSGLLEQTAKILELPRIPERIEGYDIANIQGAHAVGSMSVFTGGRADRSEYRLFNIKSIAGSNDVAMLKEVLSRRLNHPEWPFPDLLIVDGGKGQLGAAVAAMKERKMTNDEPLKKIPIIALTKDEHHKGNHIFISNKKLPVTSYQLRSLPLAVKNLILHVDAEAHRFAIAHYRKRHGKSLRD